MIADSARKHDDNSELHFDCPRALQQLLPRGCRTSPPSHYLEELLASGECYELQSAVLFRSGFGPTHSRLGNPRGDWTTPFEGTERPLRSLAFPTESCP